MRSILMTGATGFIGGELLRRLLAWDPDCQVELLVRAQGGTPVPQRLAQLLESLFPDEAERARIAPRVRAHEADLGAPGLALEPRAREELLSTASEVFHLAADVRFHLPLEEARRVNVEATRNVFDLASRARRLKRFHHVSTYATVRPKGGPRILEEAPDLSLRFRNSYEQTKAEAETMLLARAGEAPLSIYRTSIVGGDSRDGWTSQFGSFYLAIQLFLNGIAAGLRRIRIPSDASLDIVTVDSACDTLFALAARAGREPSGSIYHVVAGDGASPLAETLSQGIAHYSRRLLAAGKEVPELPEFVSVDGLTEGDVFRELEEKAVTRQDASRLRMFLRLLPYALERAIFDDSRQRAALAGIDARPRSIHGHLDAIVGYCVRSDWGMEPKPRPSLGSAPKGIL